MAAQSHHCHLPILEVARDLVTRSVQSNDIQRLIARGSEGGSCKSKVEALIASPHAGYGRVKMMREEEEEGEERRNWKHRWTA